MGPFRRKGRPDQERPAFPTHPAPVARKAVPRHHPRWEPGALTAPAGICAGGGEQSLSLPRPPSVMRTVRLIAVAAIIGAAASAATVFSLLDRPVAEESVAARTLVTPDPGRPL